MKCVPQGLQEGGILHVTVRVKYVRHGLREGGILHVYTGVKCVRQGLREGGLRGLPWNKALRSWQQRVQWLRTVAPEVHCKV
jgi:hypothetical protein